MEKHSSQRSLDIHFMKEAKLWMDRSKCLSRQIGAVLVQGKQIIASGYNGPPMGVPHCDQRDDGGKYRTGDYFIDDTITEFSPSDICPRQRMGFKSGEGMEHCVAIHAEINPIMQAAKMGISTDGATLYAYCGTPCSNCSKELINAGIKRIVVLKKQGSTHHNTGYNFTLSEKILELAGVQLCVISEEEIND